MRVFVKTLLAVLVIVAASAAYVQIALRLEAQHSVTRRMVNGLLPELGTVRIPEAAYEARVEIARTPEERQLGLSGRDGLLPGTGMLLVFDALDHHTIWMKDMRFSIDVIWIAAGTVIDTNEQLPVPTGGASTSQLPMFQPASPALLALEVPSGTVRALDLHPGQRVQVVFDGQ